MCRAGHRVAGAALWALVGVGLAVASVALALSSSGTGDYVVHGAVGGDNAGPAIGALTHLDLTGFLARQPFMGLTSLLVRAPVNAVVAGFAPGNRPIYAAGAVACLIPAALLALWMLSGATRRDERFAAAIAALVLLVSPVTLAAVQAGHPEEVLAGVLATAAVLAAIRGYERPTALLLGLAIGTKQWAVIAAVPALATLTQGRMRAAGIAIGLALLLSTAAPLADLPAYLRESRLVTSTHTADLASLWWPFSSPLHLTLAPGVSARRLPFGMTRSDGLLAVMFGAAAVLAAAALHTRRQSLRLDPLALLALLGLARCLADPGDLNYYFVAVLVPLIAWETVILKRAPIVGVAVAGAVMLTFDWSVGIGPAMRNGLMIAWALPIAAYLCRRALFAGNFERPTSRTASRAQARALVVR